MTKPYTFIDPRRPLEYNAKQVTAHLKKEALVVMPKADGVRLHLIFTADAKVYLRSRSDKPFRGLADLEKRLNADWLINQRIDLKGWTFETEAEAIDQGTGQALPCEHTNGILNRKDQVSPGRVRLSLFDAHNGERRKLGHNERLEVPFDVMNVFRAMALQIATFKRLPWCLATDLERIETLYKCYRELGYEGIVLSPAAKPYVSGKKVGAGWKQKPVETYDGKATGFIEAVDEAGNPKGIVGSIEVEYEDGTTGIAGAGALTHDERRAIWLDQPAYTGRLLEVKAMEEFETGGKRHPNFKLWRDDIEAKGIKQ